MMFYTIKGTEKERERGKRRVARRTEKKEKKNIERLVAISKKDNTREKNVNARRQSAGGSEKCVR